MRCEEFREMMDPYLAETLQESQRDAFREHLRSCLPCRQLAVRGEPSLLFSAAPPADPDRSRVDSCTAAVLSQIRQDRLARRIGRRRRIWLPAAAAATVLIAGGVAWQLAVDDDGPVTPDVAEIEAVDRASPPPRVEVDMVGDGVRVYQYAHEDDADTAVYFVVNPALEL